MNDITTAMKVANFFAGFDILARAQFMEGFAGIVPANAKLRSKTSRDALLAFIQETAMELSQSISPLWWEKVETGLFRPAYKLADRIGASQGISAHDVMQEEFSSENESGSIFYAAGRIAMRSGQWATKIKSGELGPANLQGIVKNLAAKSMKEALDKIVNRRRLEEEQASLIEEESTGVGGFDLDEWSMVTDAILAQPTHPISKEFFAWLKGLIDGMSSGSGKLMNGYLDLILSGQAKNDTEAAEMLGLPNTAYLGRIKKEFADRAANILANAKKSTAPSIQRIRDMLSDASFLSGLLRGKVPGSRTAKLIAKAQKLASLRKAASVRLLSASDYAVLLGGRQAKFPAGKSMTIDEVAEVVGPEFKEMNENPPASVQKVMQEMSRQARLLSASDYMAELEKASKFEKGKPADPTENMSEADAAEWERQNEENADKFKTAASGLYGFTKSAEKSCTGAATRLAKFAAKLAKELYTKDADTAPFMEEHAKRGSKAAKMLRQEMSNVGPGAAPKTAASKSGMGLYGFKEKTAKLAMDACSELQMEAGRQAADIAAKFGEKHATGADFLKKHAKAAKCAFSDLILDSYPASPVKVAEKPAAAKQANHLADSYLAEELMAGRTWDGDKSTPDDSVPYNKHPESPPAGADGSPQRANYNRWFRENVCPDHATNCGMGRRASFDPTVDEILAWDQSLGGRSAASFLASDEMADDELLMDGDELMAGRTWGGPNYRPKPVDDSIPYNKHPESPPAGANGSAERRRYNRWFRENVCPDHATNCGL